MIKIAIMQPYLFPYIGYWQLMKSVDIFVLLNDVNYIKKGFINRNFLLLNDKQKRFTLEIKNASQNKLIKDIETGNNTNKIIQMIYHAYKKSDYFEEVFEIVKKSLEGKDNSNLSELLFNSINLMKEYLDIKCKLILSSDLDLEQKFTGQERIIKICKILNAESYINNISGSHLYDKSLFRKNGIKLFFCEAQIFKYNQFYSDFKPGLSIIDVTMFNDKTKLKKMLNGYKISS